jgi:hypothetical protein
MKTVHDRISKLGRGYTVTLTDLQESPLGKLLHHLYYTFRFTDLCNMAPLHTGYPHNGGQHTFAIRGSKEDLVAYLELLEESFKGYWWSPPSLEELGKIKNALIEA